MIAPVIAIDGGGTKCRLAYFNGERTVVVETGSANVSTDFASSVGEITKGLAALADKVNQTPEALVEKPAFVGLAGVTGPDIAQRLRKALPFSKVRIEDDRPAALRGALGPREGVIAHCGTGSFFAAQVDGEMRFSGGWGPVLGDEASAQWIGRRALSLTLESLDGRLHPTPLSEQLLAEFTDSAGIVRFASAASPSDLGSLAQLVTRFAATGDTLAHQILQSGADEIARALPLIGWRDGLSICLTGGIGPQYLAFLPARMQAAVIEPAGTPLDGAISHARELARA